MLPAPSLSPKELVNDDVYLMSETTQTTSLAAADNRQSGSDSPAIAEPPREKLTKKAITADHPTLCEDVQVPCPLKLGASRADAGIVGAAYATTLHHGVWIDKQAKAAGK